jgi:uncharacterized alpha-E superfamily protein
MHSPLLSRVADSVYWMSRYIERAENVSRFVDVNLQLMLDLPVGAYEQWEPLLQITGDDKGFRELYGEPTKEKVIHFLTFDSDNPNSIITCLRNARENARSIRDTISSEMWEQVNRFFLMVKAASTDNTIRESPVEFFQEIRTASHLFEGITSATMTHGEAWHFCRLGRFLERADKTTRLLDVKYYILLPSVAYVGTAFDELQWVALLRSASALQMYRKLFGRIDPEQVVHFLLVDSSFPRSVHFCINESQRSLHAISGTPIQTYANPAEKQLGMLRSELDYADTKQILTDGLHEMLDLLQRKINLVDDAVFDIFFALHPQQMQSLNTNGDS